MPVIVFVAPYFTENAKRFLQVTASLPGVALGLISQDPIDFLPPEIRALVRAHVRVGDGLDTGHLVSAARQIEKELGPLHRILGVIEQIQEPLAEAREQLGLAGMSAEVARSFRDKTRMKDALRAAGLPVARHRLVIDDEAALRFAGEVGYPLVVKPPAGAASQDTFRADDDASLRQALVGARSGGGGAVLLEEFVTGEEYSFDGLILNGKVGFQSVSHYDPAPLTVMQNPWIQWRVVLPRDVDAPEFDAIKAAGTRSLEVLGLDTGMWHMEWFRRRDGSVVVSEVAARPPGAQICTLISRAHDVDCVGAWARLMVFGELAPFPERRYATGGAYLRGQGQGRVRAVHGLDVIGRELGHLITDAKLPQIGQEKARSYEGEGYILLRHPETRVVEDALRHVISTVRVELG
jgi:biotin carboxylase